MILTESNFNRIKDKKEYLSHFGNYQTLAEFDSYINNTLEVDNINILVNNIIRVIYICDELEGNDEILEIKELVLKANLSENGKEFIKLLPLLDSYSDEKIQRINRIFDKTLLNNLDKKIELLIKLEDISKLFYPNFQDKLVMEKIEVIKPEIEEDEREEYKEKASPQTYREKPPVIKILNKVTKTAKELKECF